MGCKKYIMEAVSCVDSTFRYLTKHDTPMEAGNHPELNDTKVLGNKQHQLYQILIGMLNWIVMLGRKGHIDRSLYAFDYLKKKPNSRIIINPKDPGVKAEGKLSGCRGGDQQQGAREILDEFTITAYIENDHVHDKMTRSSIPRFITFVGRTPVVYWSKRQCVIETSTYGAEFMAMKTAVEE
eukprot:2622942-Ditylum_brightwellii.AAC.1